MLRHDVAARLLLRLSGDTGILEQGFAVAKNLWARVAGAASFRRDPRKILTGFERVKIRGFGYDRNVHLQCS